MKIKRFVHNTIFIENKDLIIYIDPYKISSESKKANIVFISHEHYDHFSPEDIKKLIDQKTKVLIPKSMLIKASQIVPEENIISFSRNDIIEVLDVTFEIVPAYNTDKNYHLPDTDWAGCIINISGKRIYYAGDTDLIPEMNIFQDISLAILPISGTYVMGAEEAANATTIIKPEFVMPCHYGEIVGDEKDLELFKNKSHSEVVIDEIILD